MAVLMYLKHFGLQKNPFLMTTAPGCVYYSASHCEAVAQLLYAVRECKGIALLVGEAGTGKTTLLHTVLDLIRPAGVVASTILNPMMETAQELLITVLGGFKINVGQRPPMELLGMLYAFLEDQARMGHRAVLVVDEAQQLTSRTLENLRLVSNLEKNGQRLIQLILSAQPEIRRELSSDHHAALRQRIVVRCQLETLQPSEVWNYLALRFANAGSDGRMIFQSEAVDALAEASSCIPRVINVLADNSLLAAYSAGQDTVNAALVGSVVRHFDLAPTTVTARKRAYACTEDERSPESWKKLVSDYKGYQLPEALRDFAMSLQCIQQAV